MKEATLDRGNEPLWTETNGFAGEVSDMLSIAQKLAKELVRHRGDGVVLIQKWGNKLTIKSSFDPQMPATLSQNSLASCASIGAPVESEGGETD